MFCCNMKKYGARAERRLRGPESALLPLGASALRRHQGLHLRADPLLLLQLRIHSCLFGPGVKPAPGEIPAKAT